MPTDPPADRAYVEVDASAALATARRAAAALAAEVLCEVRADDVALVVSELATNALTHDGPPVDVEAHLDGDGAFVVRVVSRADGDADGPLPEPSIDVGFHQHSGRGLMIVQELVDELQICDETGKVEVIARFLPRPSPTT